VTGRVEIKSFCTIGMINIVIINQHTAPFFRVKADCFVELGLRYLPDSVCPVQFSDSLVPFSLAANVPSTQRWLAAKLITSTMCSVQISVDVCIKEFLSFAATS
jgi:hypothetical protein